MNNTPTKKEFRDVEAGNECSEFTARGQRIPPPPKKGEKIYCQMCGQIILPKDFSKDKDRRKKEFKWRIHAKCWDLAFNLCDLNTRGLIHERGKIYERQ